MKYRISMLMVFLVLVSCPAVLCADWWEASSLKDILDCKTVARTEPTGPIETAVRVNWVDDYIEVIAGGTADTKESVNMAHSLSVAQKTARHLAYEKLAETINGINITSDATYDRELMIDSNLKTRVEALIRGAQVIEEKHDQLADGSIWATVRLGIHIIGPNSLMSSSQPWLQKQGSSSSSLYSQKVAGQGITGLIIDASGLGIKPAMAPRIYSEGGEILYGMQDVDGSYLTRFGMVGYARSIDQAKGLDRIGANPMIIRAQAAKGTHQCDVTISKEDAAKLIQAGSGDPFLRECRVVFVVN